MRELRACSSLQFGLWRIACGLFLFTVTLFEFPRRYEMFGMGSLPSVSHIPWLDALYENGLSSELIDGVFLLKGAFLLMFIFGWHRHVGAIGYYLSSLILLNKFPDAITPHGGLIMWLVFMSVFVPEGEALSLGKINREWQMPLDLYSAAWLLTTLNYAFAAYAKLFWSGPDDAWFDGTAMKYVFLNVNASRSWIRELSPSIPVIVIHGLTYLALFFEASGPFTLPFRKLRNFWCMMGFGFNLFILATLKLSSISLGMLTVHFLLLDWSILL